jgi:hypothetical protein
MEEEEAEEEMGREYNIFIIVDKFIPIILGR